MLDGCAAGPAMRSAAEAHFAARLLVAVGGWPMRRCACARRRPTTALCSVTNAHIQHLHAAAHPNFFKPPSATTFPPDDRSESMASADGHVGG